MEAAVIAAAFGGGVGDDRSLMFDDGEASPGGPGVKRCESYLLEVERKTSG